MNKRAKGLYGLVAALILLIGGCGQPVTREGEGDAFRVVATTTMLADLAAVIGGDRVEVEGLMGPGIDPHLYQASAGDVERMRGADMILYHGLHLEGKLGEVLEGMAEVGIVSLALGESIDPSLLMEVEAGIHDPHIWFDVKLWKGAAEALGEAFSREDPVNAPEYRRNAAAYGVELDVLDAYVTGRIGEIPPDQRVLVTAHDAFRYFGAAYGMEVMGLQGVSTDAEAGTADVSRLAEEIARRGIKAIFVESSVPPRAIEALQAAVRARGFEVKQGGVLYADSLGDCASEAGSYVKMVRANVETMVEALQ